MTAKNPLTDETKARLRSVVVELVNDCLHWYVNDLEDIQKLDAEQLKWVLVDYMAMQSYAHMLETTLEKRKAK